ncbi:MAG: pilus assembly protein TadB [Rhodospirillales bacterium]|nr:MAG: pilus assembly protein TadB [Rhodospirillales bacterium]
MTGLSLPVLAAVTLLILAVVGLVGFGGPERGRLQRRAARVRTAAAQGREAAAIADSTSILRTDPSRLKHLDALARRFLPRQSILRDRLARTGRRISLGAYLLANLAIGGMVVVLVGPVAGLPPPVVILAALVAGIGIPHGVVGAMGAGRRKRFLELFPDAIDLIVRGLRSGLPVSESMSAAGRELPDPVGAEFRQIMESVRFGRELNDILWQTAERLDIAEFNFFVISLSIQQETGGNLAETLGNLSDIVRRRKQMRLKIKALTGEAKASAYILGSLPFVMFLVVSLMNPTYAGELINDPRGVVMLAAGLGSMGIGVAVMAKMVRFQI